MLPSENDRILYRGAKLTIEFAVNTNGTMEAKEWLSDQLPNVKASFLVLFARLADTGRIVNETQFKVLSQPIWEFKRSHHRILCALDGQAVYLTHYMKKAGGQGKCPSAEINRAKRILDHHLELLSQSMASTTNLKLPNKKKES